MNVIPFKEATDDELKVCALFVGIKVRRMDLSTIECIVLKLYACGMTHLDVTDPLMVQPINLMATVMRNAAAAIQATISLEYAHLQQVMPATASFRYFDNLKLVVLRYTPLPNFTALKSEYLVVQQFTALFGASEIVYGQNNLSYERRWEIQKDHYIVVGRRARTFGRLFIGFAEVPDLDTGKYSNSLLIDIDAYGTRPHKTKSSTEAVDCALD